MFLVRLGALAPLGTTKSAMKRKHMEGTEGEEEKKKMREINRGLPGEVVASFRTKATAQRLRHTCRNFPSGCPGGAVLCDLAGPLSTHPRVS